MFDSPPIDFSTLSKGLTFDEGVSPELRSMFIATEVLAILYGFTAELYGAEYSDESQNTLNTTQYLEIALTELGSAIPIACSSKEDFLQCLSAAHKILEAMFKRGITPLKLMASWNEAGVSLASKGQVGAPSGGG